MPKFRRATHFNSEVISASLLHFKPIFNSFKKSFKGATVHVEGCASKTWSFSSAYKNLEAQHPLGAEIWFSDKIRLAYVNISAYNFVRSGPNFTNFSVQRRKNRSLQRRLNFVAIFIGSKNIHGQTRKLA